MTEPNLSRPPGREPAPETPLSEAVRRLRQLRPAEPDAAARERVWRRVRRQVDASPAAQVAARLKSAAPPEPSALVTARVWERLQAEIRQDQHARRPAAAPLGPRRRLRPALGVAALALIVTLTTVNNVAQAALPGAALYPVKRAWEDARWTFTLSTDGRAALALLLADRRRAEAESLVALGQDPALVAQALAAALANLEYAAGYLPAADVSPHVASLQAAVQDWPGDYQLLAVQLDPGLSATPGPLAAPTNVATAVGAPAATVTGPAPTGVPTLPPVATGLLPSSTSTASPQDTPTSTPNRGLPSSTPVVPTLVIPTPVAPTLPALLPTATPAPADATPLPSETPIVVLPTLPSLTALPTIGLPPS